MSSTVLGLVTVAALVVAVAVAGAAGVLAADVRAQDAADAAALAAAHASGASPAAAARRAAAGAGGRLVSCACAGPVVRVTVEVPVASRSATLAGIAGRRASAAARLVPAP